MASMVAKASGSNCRSQVLSLISVHEKGSRNKRKFRADPPLGDPSRIALPPQNEISGYEFSAEKFEAVHGPTTACDLCGVSQEHSEGLKLDLGLSSGVSGCSSEVGTSQAGEALESEESLDADWSDLMESQLEELVLSNLDAIFKSAIKKIVACGYTEEVATKAILRSGLCYGCKDTVSNIVDNTLAFLRNGQEVDPSREHCFEDLQQLEKYILAELVCVLREVRPFFSTGDAMWCLLICDMNVSHACAMDGDPLGSVEGDGTSNGSSSTSSQPQTKTEAKGSDINLPNPCKSEVSVSCSLSEAPTSTTKAPKTTKPRNSIGLSGLITEKNGSNSTFDNVEKSFSMAGTSQSPVIEERIIVSRKVNSNSSKRDFILRQKSLHLEKGYRTYVSKGSRSGKLGGLILDKKLKSASESTINIKNASLRLSKVMGVNEPQDNGGQNLSSNTGPSFNLDTSVTISSSPKTKNQSASVAVATPPALPSVNTSPLLSTADTELSLSLPPKSNSTSLPVTRNAEAPNCNFTGTPYDKSLSQWVARDKKDEMIVKLVPKVRELENQLHEWTEWANQKVMQATRRLCKDRAELNSLKQEKEEVERLKKEKQTLEENTMKKLTEMENALCKASGQVERANATVRRLDVENTVLRQDMEAAKLNAAQSAASCQEVSRREKNTLMKFQSWGKEKLILQEELAAEKRIFAQLKQEVERAKQIQEQLEARWRQEAKANEELLLQANTIKKDREQIEVSAKSKENAIKLKAGNNLQKYKVDIQKLEKEIAQLRLKTDSPKIAALRRGINESFASRLTEDKSNLAQKESAPLYSSEMGSGFHDYSEYEGVKRERECVMCLSEEMSVVFLPCAHQVVCKTCNDLHEKQGMKDCPSCRSTIERRIPVRYACF